MVECLNNEFIVVCNIFFVCKGKVVVSGMGKFGYIGNKIVVMFVSIGIFVFFMYFGEVNYGDLGMLSKGDVLFVIFNFGEINEFVNLLFVVKCLGI